MKQWMIKVIFLSTTWGWVAAAEAMERDVGYVFNGLDVSAETQWGEEPIVSAGRRGCMLILRTEKSV